MGFDMVSGMKIAVTPFKVYRFNVYRFILALPYGKSLYMYICVYSF